MIDDQMLKTALRNYLSTDSATSERLCAAMALEIARAEEASKFWRTFSLALGRFQSSMSVLQNRALYSALPSRK